MANEEGRQISKEGKETNAGKQNQQGGRGATEQKQQKTKQREGARNKQTKRKTTRDKKTKTKTNAPRRERGTNRQKKQPRKGEQEVKHLKAIHIFRLRFAVRSTKI